MSSAIKTLQQFLLQYTLVSHIGDGGYGSVFVCEDLKTGQQRAVNSYDCGPWSLGFLWSLSHGHHPLQHETLRAAGIRGKVRETFSGNHFIPPCRFAPRNHPKKILKSFHLNARTKEFRHQASNAVIV